MTGPPAAQPSVKAGSSGSVLVTVLSEIPCRVRKTCLLLCEEQCKPAHIGEALPAERQRVIPREVGEIRLP